MVDVLVPFPGAGGGEGEGEGTPRLEGRLWGVQGIEYLYSTSRTGAAFITVRFKVNEPLEPSMVKVRQELDAHPELLPSGALRPVVRLLTIEDRKSTRLNSSHQIISYAVFCFTKKKPPRT